MSDEGEVVRLLVANHGRIRQHQIAEETGWSKSKVSRICSQMHSDGTIEKTSVGRENVITLSDRETTDETQLDDAERPLP
ncbi:helix-turn-helix transcriptional regulator [Natronorubrum halophilum]|uniref:helix-turn-helix transcriptional regulator n=1 Tax=Natronorubrum halophilum TaxID=1702106 RepID=UPI003083F35B